MKGSIVVILLSATVLIGVFLMSRGSGTATTTRSSQAQAYEEPGYSARNARVIETDEKGRPAYTVEAAVVRQRPNDRRVQLAAPRMSLVTEKGETVHVQARSGQIREDGSRVDLYGDVKLDGEISGTPIGVKTSILSYDTRNEQVDTDAPVTFEQARARVETKGLTVDLKQGSVTLKSGWNGKFEPQK